MCLAGQDQTKAISYVALRSKEVIDSPIYHDLSPSWMCPAHTHSRSGRSSKSGMSSSSLSSSPAPPAENPPPGMPPPGMPPMPPIPPIIGPIFSMSFCMAGPTSGSDMSSCILAMSGAPPDIMPCMAAITLGLERAAMSSGSFMRPPRPPGMPPIPPPGMPPPGMPPPPKSGIPPPIPPAEALAEAEAAASRLASSWAFLISSAFLRSLSFSSFLFLASSFSCSICFSVQNLRASAAESL
mmetsp:Transcript_10708/g.30111  ORF Transcript_10708/g.30111 Transcript_10708/m.30111 type:complete len:240 (-) Transcript_10708:809-1528(-)